MGSLFGRTGRPGYPGLLKGVMTRRPPAIFIPVSSPGGSAAAVG